MAALCGNKESYLMYQSGAQQVAPHGGLGIHNCTYPQRTHEQPGLSLYSRNEFL